MIRMVVLQLKGYKLSYVEAYICCLAQDLVFLGKVREQPIEQLVEAQSKK